MLAILAEGPKRQVVWKGVWMEHVNKQGQAFLSFSLLLSPA
jgi:hypothetical protein